MFLFCTNQIATNYPIVNVRGLYFIKLYKSQSYAIAATTDQKIDGLYQCDVEDGLTFRNYKDYVIIGGLDHRTGRVDSNNKKEQLIKIAKKHFNIDKVTHYWSANDCITYDGMPLAGRFKKKNRDVYVITGFNKWGMANAMACSSIVADLVMEQKNEFAKIFSPLRVNFSLGALLVNLGVSVYNLIFRPITPAFKSYKRLKDGQGDIVHCQGKRAVYKDENGKLHINSALCKHLGCGLRFNPNTKSWDCPCHGSRFDIDGKIITAPTVFDLDNYSSNKK